MVSWESQWHWTKKPTYWETNRPDERPPRPCPKCTRDKADPVLPCHGKQPYCKPHVNEYHRTLKEKKAQKRQAWIEIQTYANKPNHNPQVLEVMLEAFHEQFPGPGRPKGDNVCPRCRSAERMVDSAYCRTCNNEYQRLRSRARKTDGSFDERDFE